MSFAEVSHLESVEPPVETESDAATILCVDDDPNLLAALGRRLRKHGLRFISASTGREGWRMAVHHRPTAVVTDLSIPGGNGEYVLKHLKEDPATADIPVLVLTGTANRPFVREHLLGLGAELVLLKPTPFKELLQALETVMGGRLVNVQK